MIVGLCQCQKTALAVREQWICWSRSNRCSMIGRSHMTATLCDQWVNVMRLRSIDCCAIDRSIVCTAWSIDRADLSIAHDTDIVWATRAFTDIGTAHTDHSKAKQSKAEIAGAGQSLCAYQITKNAMYMYNYRAVLVIHVRQTSVTDSGQINFVIKQHLDWTNTQYLSRLFLKLSTAEITDSSRLFQIFTTRIANSK